jgi:hypothetical protein
MPARAHPSSDARYPAAAEVFWWMASDIFPAADTSAATIIATGVTSISRLVNMSV